MPATWPYKDPDEILDYVINWSARLGTDTILSSDWIVPAGLVKENESFNEETGVTVLWLSGGTLGRKYTLENRIVTTGGRTMDQSVNLSIKAK